jgi:hypothetical protein
MFELILHIGTHKTGTSSIQSFLETNKNKVYRDSGHVYINNADFNNLEEINGFKQLSNYLLSAKKNHIVSCERFSGKLYNGYAAVYEILNCFSQLEDLYRIKIIVFYREQVSFLESAYSQFIHEGGHGEINLFLQHFELDSIKYTQHLSLIKQALPKADIIAKAYHPINALTDFLAICNFNLPIPPDDTNRNQSYDFDAINFASLVNEYLNQEEKFKLRRMLQPVLYKTQNDKRKVMSSQKAAELVEFYNEDNKKLEDKFQISLSTSSQHIEGEVRIDEIAVLTKLLINSYKTESQLFPYYLKLESKILSIYCKIKHKLM